jgi:hypothetical protein
MSLEDALSQLEKAGPLSFTGRKPWTKRQADAVAAVLHAAVESEDEATSAAANKALASLMALMVTADAQTKKTNIAMEAVGQDDIYASDDGIEFISAELHAAILLLGRTQDVVIALNTFLSSNVKTQESVVLARSSSAVQK